MVLKGVEGEAVGRAEGGGTRSVQKAFPRISYIYKMILIQTII